MSLSTEFCFTWTTPLLAAGWLAPLVAMMLLAATAWGLSGFLFPDHDERLDGEDGFSDIPELTAELKRRLHEAGVRGDHDLLAIAAQRYAELEAQLQLAAGTIADLQTKLQAHFRKAYLPPQMRRLPNVRADAELGAVYEEPPQRTDDLEDISGVDAATAARIRQAGIYTFEQLRLMTPQQREHFKQRFQLSGFHPNLLPWRSLPQAKQKMPNQSGAPAPKTRTFTIPRSTYDPALGRLYSSPPAHRADLAALPGLDAAAAERLNDAGIYTLNQLLSLSPSQQAQLRQRFDLGPVDFVAWRHVRPKPLATQATPATDVAHVLGDASTELAESPREAPTEPPPRASDAASTASRPPQSNPAPTTAPLGWLHEVRLPELAEEIFNGRTLVAYREQVIFRSADPAHWGTDVSSAHERVFARSAETIRSDINYLRIRRLDTRDSVVVPITKGQLFLKAPEDGGGFNGSGETFFGAAHLGVVADLDNVEVEVSFGRGGWGFGHLVDQHVQEVAWAGQAIGRVPLEVSVGHVGPCTSTVVFRGSDPTIWNQMVLDHQDRWAIPVHGLSHPVRFVRLIREDTGDAVVVRTQHTDPCSQCDNPRLGWNGTSEAFFGGHHLGIFHRAIGQDVEVAFGAGGWGFGHPYGRNDRQAYTWAGVEIGETVFEIALLSCLPQYLEHELVH